MKDFSREIKQYYEEEIEVMKSLDYDELSKAMNAILDCYGRGGTIYAAGNGGSASLVSHMACDFNLGLNAKLSDKKFKFVSLCDNVPTITAAANDYSYEDIFIRQIEGKLTGDDLLIVVSGSGNSKNIVKLLELGKKIGCRSIAISGFDGGKIMKLADYNMHAPVMDMKKSEDIHVTFDHMMATLLSKVI